MQENLMIYGFNTLQCFLYIVLHSNQLLMILLYNSGFLTVFFFLSATQGIVALAISVKLQATPTITPLCHTTTSNNCKKPSGLQIWIFYLAGLGICGLRSSVSEFGADKFDEKDDREKSQMVYFFNRLFLFSNIGTLLAVRVLVYIQDEVNRSFDYGISAVSMIFAILVLFAGTRRYRYKKSLGSPIVQILSVTVAAIRKRKMALPSNLASLYENSPEASRIHHTDQFRQVLFSLRN